MGSSHNHRSFKLNFKEKDMVNNAEDLFGCLTDYEMRFLKRLINDNKLKNEEEALHEVIRLAELAHLHILNRGR